MVRKRSFIDFAGALPNGAVAGARDFQGQPKAPLPNVDHVSCIRAATSLLKAAKQRLPLIVITAVS